MRWQLERSDGWIYRDSIITWGRGRKREVYNRDNALTSCKV